MRWVRSNGKERKRNGKERVREKQAMNQKHRDGKQKETMKRNDDGNDDDTKDIDGPSLFK